MNWTKHLLSIGLLVYALPAMAFQDILGHGPQPKDQIEDPSPDLFSVCFQHTCAQVEHLSLSPDQWESVRSKFQPPPESAEDERQRIGTAIAYLEVEVGKQIDTLDDRGGNLEGFVAEGNQLDCVDESTNSTTYLKMMQADGLLRFHTVQPRSTRARSRLFIIGWPHSTAVVQETATGEKWVVDSWFFDNGKPPAIVPLSLWSTGWEPDT